MNRPLRRTLFWILVAAYAAGSVWWLLHVPHEPRSLLRAVPGPATIVSVHDNLDGRWDAIAAHPAALSIAGALGMSAEDWTTLQHDPGFRYILNLIGRRELLAAYVPFIAYQHQPAWVLASWLGGESHRLRWSLAFTKIPGLQRVGEIGDWPVWVYRWQTENGSGSITFAIVEGMVLGCTSPNVAAMETVIETYNGIYPSIRDRRDLADLNEKLFASGHADRFWIRPDDRFAASSPMGPWFVRFALGEGNRLDGSAWTRAVPGIGAAAQPLAVRDLANLWRGYPIAAAAFAAGAVSTSHLAVPPWATNILADVMAGGDRPWALGVFGGPLSGRFKGIKVPTIMAAVQVDGSTDVASRIRNMTDSWNRTYRWGLVPVAQPVGSNTVFRLEGTMDNLYGGFAPAEQVAVTQVGEWLVFASNYQSLESLMTLTPPDGHPSVAPVWAEQIDALSGRGGFGYAGLDLVKGGETVRLAISAYSLKLMFDDAEGSRALRQNLNEVKAWTEVLARFGRLDMVGVNHGDGVEIQFNAGRAE